VSTVSLRDHPFMATLSESHRLQAPRPLLRQGLLDEAYSVGLPTGTTSSG